MSFTHSFSPKYIFTLTVLFLFSLTFQAKDGNIIDNDGMRQGYWVITGGMTTKKGYKTAAKVEEGKYKDNRKEGLWKKYWPSGKIKNEINYKIGKPNGDYSVYYNNGQLEESGTWNKNKNTGDFKRFYENGNKQQEFVFADNGKRNGVQKYYHPNGQLELEAKIINGKEEGVIKRYFDTGKLKEEKVMHGGTVEPGSIKNYDKVDKPYVVKAETDAKSSVKVTDSPNVKQFDPNGYNTLYNKGLQKTQVGDFKKGRLWDGRWYRYTDGGILEMIEIYKEGKYVGTTDEETK